MDLFEDLILIELAVLGAYLADCFQQRSIFVQSLRSLWSHLIEAKNDIVKYTRDPSPNLEKYEEVYKSISKAIDEMRGVYKNVGENEKNIGFYPFEPLHDMRKALETLGYKNVTPELQNQTRAKVIQAWFAMRPEFLAEFDPSEPTSPIIEKNAKDSRRIDEM